MTQTTDTSVRLGGLSQPRQRAEEAPRGSPSSSSHHSGSAARTSATPNAKVQEKVLFTGTTSGDYDTAVAVDDIQIHEESCLPAGSCQFEEDFCNWRNSANYSGAMQWYRNSGATMTPGGPSVDHTRNTELGIYLLLDSQDLSVLQNGYLDSELLSYGPDICFRMFYQMAQGSDAKIDLWVKDLSKVIVHKQTISASEKSEWTLFQQDMKNLPSTYRIRISGHPGKLRKSDIAIDDIEVFAGKCSDGPLLTTDVTTSTSAHSTESTPRTLAPETSPTSEATTAEAPTMGSSPASVETVTPPTARCGLGEFDCRDDEHCIPLGLLCDGVRDCPNGLDEKCGGRNQCEETLAFCPSGSPDWCINRNFLCDGHNDCSDGSDETVCGSCPASFCLNGGHCNVLAAGERPKCTCPDTASGERCELVAGSSAELHNHSSAATAWSIAVPVVLILVGVVIIGFLYHRRRRTLLLLPLIELTELADRIMEVSGATIGATQQSPDLVSDIAELRREVQNLTTIVSELRRESRDHAQSSQQHSGRPRYDDSFETTLQARSRGVESVRYTPTS
ncbi:hypothetical protein HPB47_014563 [Ixodes persulcatus]|uniref:Uncharacterized protein n=1 Tax=Ixodes persulcatus TaxID=34615 RepID=A0AC60QY54_IXOPE|nr:hypothetical protein HPB47_014563 [Ixodes persulcatus]